MYWIQTSFHMVIDLLATSSCNLSFAGNVAVQNESRVRVKISSAGWRWQDKLPSISQRWQEFVLYPWGPMNGKWIIFFKFCIAVFFISISQLMFPFTHYACVNCERFELSLKFNKREIYWVTTHHPPEVWAKYSFGCSVPAPWQRVVRIKSWQGSW